MEEKEMFYCNIPCIVKADLGNEYLIELDLAEYYENDGYDEFGGYLESVGQTIFANKKYMTEKKIDVDKRIAKVIGEAEKKAKDIISEANNKSREKYIEAEDKLKAIKKDLLKIEGFSPYLDFLNGKTKYILQDSRWRAKTEYEYTIMSIEEFEKERIYENNDYYGHDLKAFQLDRRENRGEVEICLMQYSDCSGSERYQVWLFNTFEELQERVLSELESKSLTNRYVDNLEKFEIKHPKIQEAKESEKKRIQSEKDKKKAELEKKLKELSNEA